MKKFLSIIPFLLVLMLSLSPSAYPMGLDFGFGGTSGGPEALAFEPIENFGSSMIPLRVAVDDRGRVLVTDSLRKGFAVYSNNGLLLKGVGGIRRPRGIAADAAGNIYVGDAATRSVLVFDSNGTFLSKLGSGDGEVTFPSDMAARSNGDVYVTDSAGGDVKAFTSTGDFSFGGSVLSSPSGIVIDETAGEVYVADDEARYIRIFGLDGSLRRSFRLGSLFSSPVVRPQGLALDDTLLYIVDAFNSALAVYTKSGSFQNEYIGNFGHGPGEFRVPLDVACDKNNKCFVTNSNNQRIEVLGLNNFISLDVTPTFLTFTLLNRDFPLSQNISVDSNAPGTPWSASVSEPWMELSAVAGTTPAVTTLTVRDTGLPNGTYPGRVTFTTNNGVESIVQVELTVSADFALEVVPSSLSLLYQVGAPDFQEDPFPEGTLHIVSSGGTLPWSASSGVSWLDIIPEMSSTPATARVKANDNVLALAPGVHPATVSIDAGEVEGSPAGVDVSLRVIEAGTVMVTTNLAEAEFVLSGPDVLEGEGLSWINHEVPPGDYRIDFSHVSGYKRPASRNFSIQSGQTVSLEGIYVPKTGNADILVASGIVHSKTAKITDTESGIKGVINVFPDTRGGKATVSMAVGDLDGDGMDEAAFSDDTSRIDIYASDDSLIHFMELHPSGMLRIAMGDVDGDGRDDLLVGTRERGKRVVSSYGLDTDGVWAEKGVLLEMDAGLDFTISSGDVDGDGAPELIVADRQAVTAYDASPGGTATAAWSAPNPYTGTPSVASGDLDDDGVYEVLIGAGPNGRNGTSVTVLAGDGSPTGVEIEAFDDLGYTHGVSVSTGDVEGDRSEEVIVGAGPSPQSRPLVRIFSGKGTFTGITIDVGEKDERGALVGAGKLSEEE
jgi:hypothetical protein